MQKLTIDLLPTTSFINLDGTLDQKSALIFSGKAAGVCYKQDGYEALEKEPLEATLKRVEDTMINDHHSVYDHVNISLNIKAMPKIMAMLLNNEKQYNTSEKSGRYTKVVEEENSVISKLEIELYQKWVKIFFDIMKKEYGDYFNDFRLRTKAQENARYLVTIFLPTEMIYTLPLGQLNKLIGFMQEAINRSDNNEIMQSLIPYFEMFIDECERLNLSIPGLQTNNKHRNFSLLAERPVQEVFGDVYATNYEGTYTALAQLMRHRTLSYNIMPTENDKFYIPLILKDDDSLVNEWLRDSELIRDVNPQGSLVLINEMGTFDNFLLKAKERLCTHVQLESQQITKETLIRYRDALKGVNNDLYEKILQYDHGARCTFPDFHCTNDCKFSAGKKLVRRI